MKQRSAGARLPGQLRSLWPVREGPCISSSLRAWRCRGAALRWSSPSQLRGWCRRQGGQARESLQATAAAAETTSHSERAQREAAVAGAAVERALSAEEAATAALTDWP